MTCPERPLTSELAHPKQTHPGYRPNRQVGRNISPPPPHTHTYTGKTLGEWTSALPTQFHVHMYTHTHTHAHTQVQTIVSKGARTCTPSEHTERLAKAKERREGPFRDPEWEILPAALQATPSDRVGELAKPKKVAEGYQPSREVVWRVTMGARSAVASNR